MITRRTVWIMAVGSGLSVANLYYSQPLLERMGVDFAAPASRMGIVATATQVGYALGMLFLAPLGDLLERRRLIVVLLAATALALAAVALSPSFAWLAVASLVLGAATVTPQILVPFAAAIAEPSERGKVVGTVMSGLLIGILLARTASGFLGSHLGWRAVYWLAAGLMVVLMAVMARALPRSTPTLVGTTYGALMRSIAGLVRDLPALRSSALFGGLAFASFSVFWTVLAFHLATPPLHYGSDVVGLFGLVGAAGAAAAPLVGTFADRRGPRLSIGLGLALMLAAYAVLAAFGRSLTGLVVGVLLLDVGAQCNHISNQTRIYGLIPEARSRLNTVYMVSFFFGGAAGSAAGAAAWPRYGWAGACGVGVAFLAAALAVYATTRWDRPSLHVRPEGEASS
ncbi:MFS transporter [Paludisphaera mucosa]|uniref:MFS transporter n=1 Tax=Paludisphaera mucosa TaxID=3030827 RepID=A0ABT6F8M0_9BACT|nr:MFS transporter [Paludisphaera mucosa]MDG3003939.1 MFS transporter [Paludisphaera mucosa]